MGDMAEWCMDQEIETAGMHAAGQCDDWCPYCMADEEKKEKRRKAAAKRRKRARSSSEGTK